MSYPCFSVPWCGPIMWPPTLLFHRLSASSVRVWGAVEGGTLFLLEAFPFTQQYFSWWKQLVQTPGLPSLIPFTSLFPWCFVDILSLLPLSLAESKGNWMRGDRRRENSFYLPTFGCSTNSYCLGDVKLHNVKWSQGNCPHDVASRPNGLLPGCVRHMHTPRHIHKNIFCTQVWEK